MTLPIPAGPIRQIYADYPTYAAFPVSCRTALGTALVFYRGNGCGHVTSSPVSVLRRQPVESPRWGDPIIANPAAGFSGVACEDEDAGGRILLTCNSAGFYPSVVWSDDDGLTWSDPVALPCAFGGNNVATGAVWVDGEFLVAAYGPAYFASPLPATTIRIYASSDRGATWALRGSTVTVVNRAAQEPTLVVLADDRLAMLVRSPGAAGANDYIYTATSTDVGQTWTAMGGSGFAGLQIPFASGQPNAVVLPAPDNRVLVVHRGQSERDAKPCTSYPTVVSLLDEGAQAYLIAGSNDKRFQQLDLVGGDPRMCLYGTWLPGWWGTPDRLIWSVHNTGLPPGNLSNSKATATLYEREIAWA